MGRPTLVETAQEVRLASMRLTRKLRYGASAISPHLFAVLAMIGDKPTTAAELAKAEQVSAASMSRTVKELDERGWLTRTVHPDDKRQQLLSLTDEGRAKLAEVRARRDTWMVQRLQSCTPEERATLLAAARILNRLVCE